MEKKNQIFFNLFFFPLPAAAAPLYGESMGFWGCLHLLEMSFLRRIIQAVHGKNGGKNPIFFLIFDFFSFFQLHFMGE